VRVAEEWAVVDNLSQGRVGISFASGWCADDFLLSPDIYPKRKEAMWEGIEIFKKLWRAEKVAFKNGSGNTVEINTFPRPIQSEIPIWITCGSDSTFIEAGKIGANVLTSFLYETTDNLARQISLYRESLAKHGHSPKEKEVALMLHTYIGDNEQLVKEKVREPFCNYLKTHFNLVENLAQRLDFKVNTKTFTEEDRESLFSFAFERYLQGRVMIGNQDSCLKTLEVLEKIGVNEIACLIDFGLDFFEVMSSLIKLKELKEIYQSNNQYSALSFFG
jgi:natural product biosynthesis luciferase-like monooxygenase protein